MNIEIVLPLIQNILLGMGQGLLVSILGYAKNAGENLDGKKLIQTAVVGGAVGGIGGYLGLDYTNAYSYIETVGGITIIEYLKKAILRRLFPESVVTKVLAP